MQFDGFFWIGVRHRVQQLAHVGEDVELLMQLATERFGVRFVTVTLATGKLPVTFEMSSGRSESEEERVIALDDGGYDDGGHWQVSGVGDYTDWADCTAQNLTLTPAP